MGEAMKGNTSALADMGIKFTAAQEQMLKYGDEAQRAAALAQAITDNVGEANQALAATPEGGLQKHANTMDDPAGAHREIAKVDKRDVASCVRYYKRGLRGSGFVVRAESRNYYDSYKYDIPGNTFCLFCYRYRY